MVTSTSARISKAASYGSEPTPTPGRISARKCRRAVRCLERVLATELLCAAEGIEHRRPLRAGTGVEAAHARVRSQVLPLDGDRALSADLDALTELVQSGAFAEIALEMMA